MRRCSKQAAKQADAITPSQSKELPKSVGVAAEQQPIRDKPMDRKADDVSEGQRKTVVILSDRSREIIRLFEERQRKRQEAQQSSKPRSADARPASTIR